MPARRLPVVLSVLFLFVSTCCVAQKADVAFTLGGTFVSDANVNVFLVCPGPVCPNSTATIQNGHHIYLEGTPALQSMGLKVVSLHLEVPIAGIPSHSVHLSSSITSGNLGNLSSLFVTPALRLKVLPSSSISPISPFVALGGAWPTIPSTTAPTTREYSSTEAGSISRLGYLC